MPLDITNGESGASVRAKINEMFANSAPAPFPQGISSGGIITAPKFQGTTHNSGESWTSIQAGELKNIYTMPDTFGSSGVASAALIWIAEDNTPANMKVAMCCYDRQADVSSVILLHDSWSDIGIQMTGATIQFRELTATTQQFYFTSIIQLF